MRIATWNVNSLGARLERVGGWLERAKPDVLLLQETKLADDAAPHAFFRDHGYELAHHGQGRWNGVAIASKVGIEGVVTRFGDPPTAELTLESDEDGDPMREARMIAATCGGVRVASVYVPNGRTLASPHYEAKLVWLARLARWLEEGCKRDEALVIGGDFNVAPGDEDVWDPAACHGGTHVSERERAAIARLLDWGLVDAYRQRRPERARYSWWDYRAGHFHKNFGMRIDLLLVSAPTFARVRAAEIDREARKGKPTPSDHAPVTVDLDEPGHAFDAGWEGAAERIAKRAK
jgi:exodeoxyribonuclease III